jgi:hypothetical protein
VVAYRHESKQPALPELPGASLAILSIVYNVNESRQLKFARQLRIRNRCSAVAADPKRACAA